MLTDSVWESSDELAEHVPSGIHHYLPRSALCVTLVLAIYGISLSALIARHEVSRDEVRAYSIARAAADPVDLVRAKLVDEGHPPLWYVLLWMGSELWNDSYAVLKVASFLVAFSLVCIVLLASPFPLLHRCLFAFGVFPTYYLSVLCRSYGLAAFLVLLLAVEYSRKPTPSPWRLGTYGALLATTTVYGAIVACAFLLVPIQGDTLAASRRRHFGIVAFLIALGLGLCAYTIWPTHDNLAVSSKAMRSLHAGYATFATDVLRTLYDVGTDRQGWVGFILTGFGVQTKLSSFGYSWLASAVGVAGLVVLARFLWRWPRMLMAFGFCIVSSGLFAALVYPASELHIGVVATFLLALLWIVWSRHYTDTRPWRYLAILLGLSLLGHAAHGMRAAFHSLDHPFSASKVAGAFLNKAYPAAILICEPDAYGESLPYYASNPIYLVREGAFSQWVHFERRFNRVVTLSEIMDAALRIQETSGETVLVSLPKAIREFRPGSFHWAYGRALTITAEELQRFSRNFEEIAAFTDASMETFVFYKAGTVP